MKKVYILSAVVLFAIALAGITSAGFMRFGHHAKNFDPDMTKEEMFEKKQEYMRDHIEQMLADGEITQEQADEKMEWMEGMHEKFLSGEFEGKKFHKKGGFKHKFGDPKQK